MVKLNFFLVLSAFLFSVGIYGVLARRNAVMLLLSVELMLNGVNIALVAMGVMVGNITGQIFALFVIAVAAAEVGVGLGLILLVYRNKQAVNVDEVDLMKG
ncbi:MAG: NADH-quinone oxidoreductase subunit NuoK [Actinobacteria bacterium ATB1]|nr:NADH-quinone oxidoreductase subunit NuoK [Actinobacteria bacterium ATB1]